MPHSLRSIQCNVLDHNCFAMPLTQRIPDLHRMLPWGHRALTAIECLMPLPSRGAGHIVFLQRCSGEYLPGTVAPRGSPAGCMSGFVLMQLVWGIRVLCLFRNTSRLPRRYSSWVLGRRVQIFCSSRLIGMHRRAWTSAPVNHDWDAGD